MPCGPAAVVFSLRRALAPRGSERRSRSLAARVRDGCKTPFRRFRRPRKFPRPWGGVRVRLGRGFDALGRSLPTPLTRGGCGRRDRMRVSARESAGSGCRRRRGVLRPTLWEGGGVRSWPAWGRVRCTRRTVDVFSLRRAPAPRGSERRNRSLAAWVRDGFKTPIRRFRRPREDPRPWGGVRVCLGQGFDALGRSLPAPLTRGGCGRRDRMRVSARESAGSGCRRRREVLRPPFWEGGGVRS